MDRIEKLKEFMASSPEDNFIRHALAMEYIKQGNDAEAQMMLENLLNTDEKYIGSYYHLARLLERTGKKEEAIKWYEKGMQMAKDAGDMHSFNELRAGYDDLIY
ncbi:MAG: tetratricopeptide repeat protein [Flavisolibacter sp.]